MKRPGILLAVMFGLLVGMFYVSYLLYRKAMVPRNVQKVIMIPDGGWSKIGAVLNYVDANYVDSVDRKKLTDEILMSALQSLDPHSVYMEPEILKEADEDLSGRFEGVGLQFNVPNDTAVVLNVIAGGPAERAGMMSGDRILKVDDMVIAGTKTPQDTMVRHMKGPKGTRVVLTIEREKEIIPFDITRDVIPEHSVDASFMIDDKTAYLRLFKFSSTTFEECYYALSDLSDKGMQSVIMDLRDNGGGYFDQVCNLANLFLDKDQLIVYMEGRNRARENVNADGRGPFKEDKVYVLINENSASASEIMAGAIQDNDRGLIVGRRSFGKGLVQEPVWFSDGSGVRLTVARYHTPSGRCIQKPYDNSGEYAYDVYNRYMSGELLSQDKIQVDSSQVYYTRLGRKVYGGGGIIPDVFVPMDTTRATNFHIQCNKKALSVRFANKFFENHRKQIVPLSTFSEVEEYLNTCGIEQAFLAYAASFGLRPARGEWEDAKQFLLPQIKGLCARYSKVGEEAYYRYILPIDDVVQAALNADLEETEL